MTPENKNVEIVVNNKDGFNNVRGKTVMVVEGTHNNAALLAALQEQGYEVREAPPQIDPEVAEHAQAQADQKAGKETYLDIPESELPVPKMDPFQVENRSRAEKVVKMLYGPKARVRTFPNQDRAQTQVVVQDGSRAIVLREAADLSALLAEPLESYVKGGKDLQDTEQRISQVAGLATLGIMAYRALMQFPQYVDRRRKHLFKQREAQRKAEAANIPFKDLVAEAKKTLGEESKFPRRGAALRQQES